jgi:hypothetical protein
MFKKRPLPQFMITYLCPRCHLDSGRTELDPPLCYMCDSGEGLIEISREPLSREVMFNRMKICSDRMIDNLRKAYDVAEGDWPKDDEQELMLLEAMARGQDIHEALQELRGKP